MNKTKIEWCDRSWNPITGCLHSCEYCYARGIARRFGGYESHDGNDKHGFPILTMHKEETVELHDLSLPLRIMRGKCLKTQMDKAPYPFVFAPTFHRYRLNNPETVKKAQTIFVCSMADLFGYWVPDEWIQDVFNACAIAPWHRYLFLTKNPARYADVIDYIEGEKSPLTDKGLTAFFGTTVTNKEQLWDAYESSATWLSIEPLLEDISNALDEHFTITRSGDCAEVPRWAWIVLGAETGNRKDKVIPKREWIDNIVTQCRAAGVPVFMKNSMKTVWGDELITELPWKQTNDKK